jgi:hypothetical protein
MKRLLSVFVSLALVISLFSSNLVIKGDALSESFVQSEINYPQLQLSFTPTDSAMDTTKPIVYLTDKTNKRVYAINYVTGSISNLTFGLMPESIYYNNNEVYNSTLGVRAIALKYGLPFIMMKKAIGGFFAT